MKESNLMSFEQLLNNLNYQIGSIEYAECYDLGAEKLHTIKVKDFEVLDIVEFPAGHFTLSRITKTCH